LQYGTSVVLQCILTVEQILIGRIQDAIQLSVVVEETTTLEANKQYWHLAYLETVLKKGRRRRRQSRLFEPDDGP
jgi:hypothetical protein